MAFTYPVCLSQSCSGKSCDTRRGAESLYIGLNNANEFAWIGGFSIATLLFDLTKDFPAPDAKQRNNSRLLGIACWVDDHLIDVDRQLIEFLKPEGLQPTYVETPGSHT